VFGEAGAAGLGPGGGHVPIEDQPCKVTCQAWRGPLRRGYRLGMARV
jgi:hypothetical protein